MNDYIIDEGLNYEDDKIWDRFKESFRRAFESGTEKQDAYTALQSLQMKEGQLDVYITTHANLVRKAGWDDEGDGAIEFFKKGLPKVLHQAILLKTDMPETMQEWYKAAHIEHACYVLMKASRLAGEKPQKLNKPEYYGN